jgi:FixJ family two-component response regulator
MHLLCNPRSVTSVTLPAPTTNVSWFFMRLKALLMCRNQQALQLLATELENMGFEYESCFSAKEAMESLVREPHAALVVDFDLPGAEMVVHVARAAHAHRRPVVFAVIGALTAIRETFEAGANFVLYKPLSAEQVERSLRAGQGFMKPDRRRSQRQATQSVAYLMFNGSIVPAVVQDLNEDGMALRAADPLPATAEVPFRFALPGSTQLVEGTAQLLWADEGGRVGMFFSDLTATSRKHLQSWLSKRSPRGQLRLRAARHSEKARRAAAVH